MAIFSFTQFAQRLKDSLDSKPILSPILSRSQSFLVNIQLVGSKNWSKGLYLLKQGTLVPGAMTLYVYGHREAGDVAGKGLHMDGQGSNSSPEALRADAQPVHRL